MKCWLWETLANDNAEVTGGVEAITTAYRLFLPVGTPIENGDRVVVKGETYIVVATNAENTYRPVLRVQPAEGGVMSNGEEVLGHTEASQPMPLIGETIVVMGTIYRCISVAYADAHETGGEPEIRVRFKRVKEAG